MITTKQLVYAFFLSCISLFVVASFAHTKEPEKQKGQTNATAAPGISMSVSPNQDHYLNIFVSPQKRSSYFITDWKIKNARGKEVRIGKASSLPKQGEINQEQPILVPGGSKIILADGYSPIGVSFRVNSCSGFLEQYQNFSPPLEKNCPSAKAIILPEETYGLENACLSYINSMPSCHNPIKDLELSTLSASCNELLTTKVNYNTCIARLSTTDDFYKNEWRLYLGKDKNIWDGAFELLSLFDQDGRLLSTLSY